MDYTDARINQSEGGSMSDVLERFLRYVQVGSPSDPEHEEQVPSTACQHDMARLLGRSSQLLA